MTLPLGGPATHRPRTMATIVLALGVFAGYLAGAKLGLVLRLPPATTSVLWPPNAILTAALLLTPPRRWWIALLAAFPAHLLAELEVGFPLNLVLAFFATNVLEALLAATAVRIWSDEPTRFDTLRRVGVFAAGVLLLANALSSVVDAAAVNLIRGEPYGPVWYARFLSNALASLTLVPALVIVASRGPRVAREWPWTRRLEALALGASFLVPAAAVFVGPGRWPWLLPGVPHTSLVVFLPLLLWAAVRFGAGGSSLALLLVAGGAIGAATLGYHPFFPLAADDRVLALQVFLLMAGLPLLFLTALIAERKRIQETLEERLRFEEYRSRLTGAFVHLASDQMDVPFATWLQRLATLIAADQAALLRFLPGGRSLEVTSAWPGPEPGVADSTINRWDFPWAAQRLLEERTVAFARLEGLPEEAERERDAMATTGLQAGVAVPLIGGGRVLGCLVLATTTERDWTDEQIREVRLTADVLGGALARKISEDALRASESMKSAILSSLTSHVAVLDAQGRIIAVNESWTRFALESGLTSEETVGVGVDYLDVCRKASDRAAALGALDALGGIASVLDGTSAVFSHEYSCPTPREERWFLMTAVPLHRREGGAVVSHTEVTERRQAEAEAERSRQQLAHTLRVSTIGELTTSLAHELNQPLAAILANAQAAQKLLDTTSRGRELREILGDIVGEDKRAGEVIRRLRALLRKGETEHLPLDLNGVAEESVRLVRSDALIRAVSLRLEVSPRPLVVQGDRVQIQQVVLNLLVNALEAVDSQEGGDRTVTVGTDTTPGKAWIRVRDSGPGLTSLTPEEAFEPFFTTKKAGLGMGLSIARTIVQAHGGAISSATHPSGGALLEVSFPLVTQNTSHGEPAREIASATGGAKT